MVGLPIVVGSVRRVAIACGPGVERALAATAGGDAGGNGCLPGGLRGLKHTGTVGCSVAVGVDVVVGQVLGDGCCAIGRGVGGQQVVAHQAGVEGHAGHALAVVAYGGGKPGAGRAMGACVWRGVAPGVAQKIPAFPRHDIEVFVAGVQAIVNHGDADAQTGGELPGLADIEIRAREPGAAVGAALPGVVQMPLAGEQGVVGNVRLQGGPATKADQPCHGEGDVVVGLTTEGEGCQCELAIGRVVAVVGTVGAGAGEADHIANADDYVAVPDVVEHKAADVEFGWPIRVPTGRRSMGIGAKPHQAGNKQAAGGGDGVRCAHGHGVLGCIGGGWQSAVQQPACARYGALSQSVSCRGSLFQQFGGGAGDGEASAVDGEHDQPVDGEQANVAARIKAAIGACDGLQARMGAGQWHARPHGAAQQALRPVEYPVGSRDLGWWQGSVQRQLQDGHLCFADSGAAAVADFDGDALFACGKGGQTRKKLVLSRGQGCGAGKQGAAALDLDAHGVAIGVVQVQAHGHYVPGGRGCAQLDGTDKEAARLGELEGVDAQVAHESAPCACAGGFVGDLAHVQPIALHARHENDVI